jgi:2-polyprenyl-3-methyl-5-hydroxy-6-metoxy-1,4-benzoquinol methylase
MRRVASCPVCFGDDLRPFALASGKRVLHSAQARCAGCGLLVAQPQATDEELERFYRDTYHQELWPDPDRYDTRKDYERYDLPVARELWRDWPPRPGAEVVEVGTGWGEMQEILRGAGFRVRGCEMSPRAVARCRERGLDVVEGRWPDLPFAPASADVAIALQVIEHVADPRGFVRDLTALVRPGGLVVVATEDAGTSQAALERALRRLRGRTPEFCTSPDHTFVFLARHLRRLLEDAGCEVRTRSYSYVPRESLHWKVYKGLLRTIDRITGHGAYLMAVGRRLR